MLYLKNIFILYEFNVIVIEFFIKIENAYFGRRSVVRGVVSSGRRTGKLSFQCKAN